MKKTVLGLIGFLILGLAGVASAIPYQSVENFSGSGTHLGQTYLEISDSNSSDFVGLYTHTVTFDPAAVSLQSASLEITYAFANELLGSGAKKEVWFISEGSGTQIGELTGLDNDQWTSKTFDLSSYISGISGTSWSIGFKFNETTIGTDRFYLDKSVLFGDYTGVEINPGDNGAAPVPEPGTIVLLGVGLVGLGILINRRRCK